MAHSLKGLGASIGAMPLSAAAGAVERAITKADRSEYSSLIEALAERESSVMDSIARLVTRPTTPTPSGCVAGDREELTALLVRLEPEVRARKPRHCAPILQELRSRTWPDELDEEVPPLIEHIRRYRFRDALTAIRRMTSE